LPIVGGVLVTWEKEPSPVLVPAVGAGRQPERLIAASPGTLAEERDYAPVAPVSLAHDLVDATPKRYLGW
jgi:hypothetical protein